MLIHNHEPTQLELNRLHELLSRAKAKQSAVKEKEQKLVQENSALRKMLEQSQATLQDERYISLHCSYCW